MGEEEKKAEEQVEEKKKEEEAAVVVEDEKKKKEEEKKSEEIVLQVFMHCEGCARKVRRCLKGFEGVEDVITDCRSSRVVVKGEKADPLKVLDKLQKKTNRQVHLISPTIIIPPPQPPKEKEILVVKTEDKKEEELPVITLVLGVYMHCEACAQEIKKRILKIKGVESAEPELKGSQVTVKGAFEPDKLIDFVHKRTGKHAVIVKVEPEKKEEEEKKGKEGKEEEKKAAAADEGKGGKEAKKTEEKEGAAKENKEGGGDAPPPNKPVEEEVDDPKLIELKKNELYYYHPQNNYQVYPQRFVQDMYAYPPQIFSDENPNACSVM